MRRERPWRQPRYTLSSSSLHRADYRVRNRRTCARTSSDADLWLRLPPSRMRIGAGCCRALTVVVYRDASPGLSTFLRPPVIVGEVQLLGFRRTRSARASMAGYATSASTSTTSRSSLTFGEWRERCNRERPHKAFEWQTPEEFASPFSTTPAKTTLHLSSVA